ncbi:pirin family protein [Corynebacterium sp. H113]|uniref:pirin family protein n=1 Tax=Corynebacterium sp. H113 TaxID=3133419 RepID=UPI0030AB1570
MSTRKVHSHSTTEPLVEIIASREVPLGGPRGMTVQRTIPQRQRSMIGAWCFCDHFGPDDVAKTGGMDVAPHPHTGLQTVSWLFEGNVTHHDSGDNHGVVRPGEVNLMTAGAGICHSEVSTQDTTILHGVQLWTVLPDAARNTAPRSFEHYAPELIERDGLSALVFVGSLLGETSPIRTFSPLVGAELRLAPGASATVPVDAAFEHGLLVDSGEIQLNGTAIPRTAMGYTGVGETVLTITNTGTTAARMVLIGGEPFGENIVMWWNFIGRTHDEVVAAREAWQREGRLPGPAQGLPTTRFGKVDGYVGHRPDGLSRLPAPGLPRTTLKARVNPAPHAFSGPRPLNE